MQKLIVKNFFLFSFPSTLVRLTPLLILPITSQYFTLDEFGLIVLLEVLIIPFHILINFGSNHIINSSWHKNNLIERKKTIFTTLLISFFYWFIGISIIVGFLPKIIEISIFQPLANIKNIYFYLILMSFSLVPGIIFACWSVIQNKGYLYVIIRVVQSFSILTLSVHYTITYQYFEFLIFIKVFISFIIAIIELFILIKFAKFNFSVKKFFNIIELSSSFIARNLLNQAKAQFDRLFISYLYGPGQFVLYTYSGKINNFFNEISEQFQNAYNPKLYQFISLGRGSSELNFIFFTWSVIVFYVNSIIIVFGGFFVDWISNSLFIDAIPIINIYSCVIILTLPFIGNFEVLVYNKESKYLFIVSILHGFLTISVGYFLILKTGIIGGVISFWIGTLFTGIMYFLRKRGLKRIYFMEKTLISYVIIYHFIVLIHFLGFFFESYVAIVLMLFSITFHYYKNYKSKILYFFSYYKKL